MTPFHSRLVPVAAALCLLAAATPAALAQSAAAKSAVDQAKTQGIVGEQADGYLGFVGGGGDGSVRSAVAEINAGRAEAYRQTAARTGVTPEAAGQATARQLYARLPSGEYWRGGDSRWEKR